MGSLSECPYHNYHCRAWSEFVTSMHPITHALTLSAVEWSRIQTTAFVFCILKKHSSFDTYVRCISGACCAYAIGNKCGPGHLLKDFFFPGRNLVRLVDCKIFSPGLKTIIIL